jgi:tRNA-specific 2-thiouridylase
MSGGVDSSCAAYLLKEAGYEVIGATLKLWQGECSQQAEKKGRPCCSLDDLDDARQVANKLGIPFYVFDFSAAFKKCVIDDFCRAYAAGRTPNPCIVCNQKIKFGLLWDKAKKLGCQYLATGHYARIGKKNKKFFLKEAKDKRKSQAYFLFTLTSNDLAHLLFPVGDYQKEEIRALAKKIGLKVHDKPESQEVCFVRQNKLADFLKERLKGDFHPGNIVDRKGNLRGRHKGICFYTYGQRKGLGISAREPLYVVEIKAKENLLVVGTKKEARKDEFWVKDLNWMGEKNPPQPIKREARIRYLQPKAKAVVYPLGKSRARVKFAEKQFAITPGQAAVFYDRDTILGGGWIEQE